jgi:DNA (cytosine-5)-methyltransferase 1
VLTVADLFAGCGGLSLGFAQAGFDVVWGGEAFAPSAATYAAAFPDAEVFEGWITGSEIPPVDVQIGGPPCQPFSSAGVQRGQYDPRDGIPIFIRGLGASEARAFAFEEVPDVAYARHRGYFEAVLEDLATVGFHVAWAILDAADYGVAQNRKRLFVVGFRDPRDAARFSWPAKQPRVTVEQAIGDLVPWYGPGPTRHSRPVELDAPIPGARILNRGRGGTRNPARPKALLYKWTMPDEQAATITVSNEAKSSEHALRVLVGWPGGEFERRLSNLELARLQGFPDGYPWQGSAKQVAHQIGNAVAPPVSHAVARSLRAALTR